MSAPKPNPPSPPETASAADSGSGFFDVLLADINGVFRGQRLLRAQADGLLTDGSAFPASLYSMRYDGYVVEETGVGLCAGDNDYPIHLLPDRVSPMPWQDNDEQGVFVMRQPDGEDFYADPRCVLQTIVNSFTAIGLIPVLAVELEFFLRPQAEQEPEHLYSMDLLDEHKPLIDLMHRSAAAQNIPVGAVISEYAPGQMEMNLRHREAMAACLDALLFRRLTRGCARQLGQRATFMAKPYAAVNGSGMHIHLSFKKTDGGFLFADEDALFAAVAGALSVIGESVLLFAPFDNSYRRFVAGRYIPMAPTWGMDNRSAAVRIPAADSAGEKRLEFRLAGADANPYLVAAALLAGVWHGLHEKPKLPPELKKEYTGATKYPITWRAAIDAFTRAKILPRYIAPAFMRHYREVKESEWRHHRDYVSDYDRRFYGSVL